MYNSYSLLLNYHNMSKVQSSIDILKKREGKILTQQELYALLENWEVNENGGKKYKIVYYLKLRGYLIPLKRNLFFVSSPEKKRTEDQISSLFYREILIKMGKELFANKRYLWGLKALEIRIGDRDIRDEILLVNGEIQGDEIIIFDKIAQFKTYKNKGKNLISDFVQCTDKVEIWWRKMILAKPELAILEMLYNSSTLLRSYNEELIKKWIKKNKKNFDFWLIEKVLKLGKHNSSVNKLMDIVMTFDQELAEKLKASIKRFWYLLY